MAKTTRKQPRQSKLFEARRPDAPVRRVRRGVDATIAALRSTGRLEPVDAGLVALARTLADDIDTVHVDQDGSRFTVATLAARLHPVLVDLRGELAHSTDEIDALLAEMRAHTGPPDP